MLLSIKISRNLFFFFFFFFGGGGGGGGSDKLRTLFLINVKMPTIVGILTFMSKKKFMLS